MFEVCERTLKAALKMAEMAEVYVEAERALEVEIQRDRVDFAKVESVTGVGIRVINRGRMGFAYSSDPERLDETVERAVQNSRIADPDENFKLSEPSDYPSVNGIYDKTFNSIGVDESVEIAQILIDTALEMKCAPTSGGFSASTIETFLVNSNGVEARAKSTGFSAHISVNAERGDLKSTAYESDSSCRMELDPERISRRACRIAIDSIGGVAVETGDMPVLLDYHASAGLLGTFADAFNADNVQRGRSVLKGREGSQVTSEGLSIYDDGSMDGALRSAPFDGEGTPTQRTPLVEDGILKGFIYDIYTASKGGVESTGNGMRGYSDTPGVALSNFLLEFEEVNPADDFRGILVTDVLGAHTANPISGDFSVEANNAFLVDSGESKPVKKMMLSGNIFSLMEAVSCTDASLRQIGPFILRPLVVDRMRVIG